MPPWREYLIPTRTPNGGVLAIVHRDATRETTVITEYDSRGLVLYRFEYELGAPEDPGNGHVATLSITDWDDEPVGCGPVARFPPASIDAGGLAEFLTLRHR